jgi:hypothetical protein
LKAVLLHNGNKLHKISLFPVLDWPKRDSLTPSNKNVRHPPLVNPENVYLPPLHIKLGLMKHFVKGIDQNGAGFAYLKETE